MKALNDFLNVCFCDLIDLFLRTYMLNYIEYIELIQESKLLPHHIVVLRDGLSDSQIEETSGVEMLQIDEVLKSFANNEPTFKPTVTYIVMQRRHGVRFYMPE